MNGNTSKILNKFREYRQRTAEGGKEAPSTPMETTVVTGIVRLAAAMAESRFCMAGRTLVSKSPGTTSLPAVMYRKVTEFAYGTTLAATHWVAKDGSEARRGRSPLRVPRTTSMAEPSRAWIASCWGSKRRTLGMFRDLRRETTCSGGGRLLPSLP